MGLAQVADDLGYDDLGHDSVLGNSGKTHTPAINALIDDGIAFHEYCELHVALSPLPSFHVNGSFVLPPMMPPSLVVSLKGTPFAYCLIERDGAVLTCGTIADTFKVCSPTRASLLTGRYPFNAGFYDMSEDGNHCTAQFKLLPALLKEQGYSTHALGKWDVGDIVSKCTPTYSGFDSFLGYYEACLSDYWWDTPPATALALLICRPRACPALAPTLRAPLSGSTIHSRAPRTQPFEEHCGTLRQVRRQVPLVSGTVRSKRPVRRPVKQHRDR